MDGNKRTAAHAAVVFLDMNGMDLELAAGELRAATLAAAEGRVGKDEELLRARGG